VQWVSAGWSEDGMTIDQVKQEWLWVDYVKFIDQRQMLTF